MTPSAMITFPTARGPAEGYLTGAGARRPGLVVIQEYWGLVPHIKEVADRLAREGYVALAPDLYHGRTTVEEEEASHLLSELDWGRAVEELRGGVAELRERQGCTAVGVIGFCMGGALTVLAAQDPGVAVYAAFYGFPPDPTKLGAVNAPGIIFFGEEEGYFSVPNAQSFAEIQQRKGIPTEVIVYAEAGHAFFNDTRPEAYRPKAAAAAWDKTIELFRQYLPRP